VSGYLTIEETHESDQKHLLWEGTLLITEIHFPRLVACQKRPYIRPLFENLPNSLRQTKE
jgi:hypothetical protein